jgi:hypothetical protein
LSSLRRISGVLLAAPGKSRLARRSFAEEYEL